MNKSEIRNQVEEFMVAAEQTVPDKPTVPSDNIVRLRAKLILEEAIEYLEATYGKVFDDIKLELRDRLEHKQLKVDIIEIADALSDIDYVSEGARLAFGINGKEIADEVQRTNMAKFGPGSWKDENGKQRKPPNWQSPNIKSLLIEQGWDNKNDLEK